MDLVSIDAEEVARLLPYEALVDELAAAHRAAEPLSRRVVFGPGGTADTFLGLPAWDPGEALGVKLVTVFPANLDRGVASVQAVYVLFDGADGSPVGGDRRNRADLPQDGCRLGARRPLPRPRRRHARC